jgi:hypothetical protein
VLLVAPGAASAMGTLDQEQTNTSAGFGLDGPGSGSPNSLAQTFTAGLTGQLDHVEVFLARRSGTLPVKVEIRTVEGSGAPSATVLASETIPAASIPPGGAFESVAFTPPPMVVAGTQYAIVVYSSEPLSNFLWFGATADVYPGGAAWSSTIPPTTWTQGASGLNPVDLAFKTYVTQITALARGSFAIGDQNATVGANVEWWGSNWSKVNSLSGGPAPAAFKGFAESLPGTPMCGESWTTKPGNSSRPPATVPEMMEVIASSKITKSGSTISGDVREVALVKTSPGYAPNPGHKGTGKVEAILCKS